MDRIKACNISKDWVITRILCLLNLSKNTPAIGDKKRLGIWDKKAVIPNKTGEFVNL